LWARVSTTQVSRATKLLDDELTDWRKRPVGKVQYLLLDARYENVRQAGAVLSCAVLIAVGITEDGRRSVLGASVSLSEAEVHWRDFLANLWIGASAPCSPTSPCICIVALLNAELLEIMGVEPHRHTA
jgi:transposase-like protein